VSGYARRLALSTLVDTETERTYRSAARDRWGGRV